MIYTVSINVWCTKVIPSGSEHLRMQLDMLVRHLIMKTALHHSTMFTKGSFCEYKLSALNLHLLYVPHIYVWFFLSKKMTTLFCMYCRIMKHRLRLTTCNSGLTKWEFTNAQIQVLKWSRLKHSEELRMRFLC